MLDPGPFHSREGRRHQGHPDASLDKGKDGLGFVCFVADFQGDSRLPTGLTDCSTKIRASPLANRNVGLAVQQLPRNLPVCCERVIRRKYDNERLREQGPGHQIRTIHRRARESDIYATIAQCGELLWACEAV